MKIRNNEASDRQLSEICRDLENGQTMIMPTDTLYGLACDALNPKAIEKICRLKGINPDKTNLSIICSSISMAAEYARFDNYAFRLLKDLTPGHLHSYSGQPPLFPKLSKEERQSGSGFPITNYAMTSSKGSAILS